PKGRGAGGPTGIAEGEASPGRSEIRARVVVAPSGCDLRYQRPVGVHIARQSDKIRRRKTWTDRHGGCEVRAKERHGTGDKLQGVHRITPGRETCQRVAPIAVGKD